MLKEILRILAILLATVLVSNFHRIPSPSDAFISTLYTVCGIVFSVGLGFLVSFSLQGLENKNYIAEIRKNLAKVRRRFIFYFLISTCCILLSHFIAEECSILSYNGICLNLRCLFAFAIIYSIAYFVWNFLVINHLKDEIFDRILKEKTEKRNRI